MSQIEINQRSFKYGDYYLAKLERGEGAAQAHRRNPVSGGHLSDVCSLTTSRLIIG